MFVEQRDTDGWQGRRFRLPFGYFVQRDSDLLVLLRPDHTFVAAFGAMVADPFEVEAAVWEDAD